jgi:hypothetical protein
LHSPINELSKISATPIGIVTSTAANTRRKFLSFDQPPQGVSVPAGGSAPAGARLRSDLAPSLI